MADLQQPEIDQAITSDNATDEWRLVATGFNAHHQIYLQDGNISKFTVIPHIPPQASDKVLFAGWSNTVLAGSKNLTAIGLQRVKSQVEGGDGLAQHLRCGFGDHDGMRGCLDEAGQLYLVGPSDEPTEEDYGSRLRSVVERRGIAIDQRLSCRSMEDSPLISHIAMAQNGRVSLSFQQALKGRLCHLVEFRTLEAFQRWFQDPSNADNQPESHHMLPGRPKQLSANIACFILLMDSGEVYTWGDARYESLARSVNGEGVTPADQPGLVDPLGGLKIVSISTGGWISAAVSEDGALYIWGAMTPGSDGSIACLHGHDTDDVSLVDISGSGSEALDVHNVAVGDNHILAIAGDEHHIYAVGDNRSGQLGLGIEQDFFPDWQRVTHVWGANWISCGPKTSWAVVRHWA